VTDQYESQIAAKLAQLEQQNAYEHYRPLRDAADEFINWAVDPASRVYTGIPELDDAMRGTAPGELTLIQGFTHSGKTLVATELLLNNPDTPLVLFTPDETRPLVLTKLTSALHGVSARELETRIQQDDYEARQLLIETAEQYGKLAIFDDSVSVVGMDRMFDEAMDAMGCKPKGVIFDYAELLEGPDDVKQKMTALKAWGKRHGVAMFVIHQTSRSSGSGGKKMQIDSGSFGGEQQATHVIGVRRKKYMHLAMLAVLEEKIANASNPTSIQQYQQRKDEIEKIYLPRDKDTLTVSVVKNKRPPCDLVDDVDYLIDQETGRIQRLDVIKDEYGQDIRVRKSVGLQYLAQVHEQQQVQKALDDLEDFR
jgi:KaiC/GvpD/RAD55 family RecA-like ATPase